MNSCHVMNRLEFDVELENQVLKLKLVVMTNEKTKHEHIETAMKTAIDLHGAESIAEFCTKLEEISSTAEGIMKKRHHMDTVTIRVELEGA